MKVNISTLDINTCTSTCMLTRVDTNLVGNLDVVNGDKEKFGYYFGILMILGSY